MQVIANGFVLSSKLCKLKKNHRNEITWGYSVSIVICGQSFLYCTVYQTMGASASLGGKTPEDQRPLDCSYESDSDDSLDPQDDIRYNVASESDTTDDSDSNDDSIPYLYGYIDYGTVDNPKMTFARHGGSVTVDGCTASSSATSNVPDASTVRVWSLRAPYSDMSYTEQARHQYRRFRKRISRVIVSIVNGECDAFDEQVIQLKVKHSTLAVPFHKTILLGQSVDTTSVAKVLTALSELDVPHGSIERFIVSTCCNRDWSADIVGNNVVECSDLDRVQDLSHLFGAFRIGQVLSRHLTEAEYGARWFTILRWITTILCCHIPTVCSIDQESPEFPYAFQVMSDIVAFITAEKTGTHYSDAWESQAYLTILHNIPISYIGRLLVNTLSANWLALLTSTPNTVNSGIFIHPLQAMCYMHFEYNVLPKMSSSRYFQQEMQLPSHSCHWQMAQTIPANFCISIKSCDENEAESSASPQKEGVVTKHVASVHIHDWVMMQWPFFKRMFVSQSVERQTRHLQLPFHFPVAVLEAILTMCYQGGRKDLTNECAFIEELADEYELVDLLMLNAEPPKAHPASAQKYGIMSLH